MKKKKKPYDDKYAYMMMIIIIIIIIIIMIIIMFITLHQNHLTNVFITFTIDRVPRRLYCNHCVYSLMRAVP